MIIPHSRPSVSASDARAVAGVVRSGQLAQGKGVALFERKFASRQKIKYAAAVNTGTSALHLSLLALGAGKGDNVIVPSYVCTALLNAVRYTGAAARVADVNEDDFNISVKDVKKRINARTKAVIVPHMFGLPADLSALLKLGVPVIEDCAQALGARYRGKPAGSFGLLSVYSFYATKMMATGEGGMVASNNRKLIGRVRDLREYDEKPDDRLRYNYKMMDIQAALGLGQLSKVPSWVKKRRKIARRYHQAFEGRGFLLPVAPAGREHVYFRYVLRTKHKRKLLNTLRSKGIQAASPVFKPLHEYLGLKGYPHAQRLMKEAVSLPVYPSLSEKEMKYILRHVK